MAISSNTTQSINLGESGPPEFCIPLHSTGSKGIWIERNHLEHPYPLVMAKIILVTVLSQVLHCFLKPLGQTKFVCNLLAGIILGPSVIGHNMEFRNTLFGEKEQFPLFDVMAKLGVIYSMFLISVKLDLAMLKRTAKTSWKIILATLLCPTAVFFSIIYPLAHTVPGFNGGKVMLYFTMCSLSFTYFPVVAQVLDELNLLTSELGQLALSAAILNDALQLFLTSLLLVVAQENAMKGIESFLSLFALVTFTICVARPLMLLTVKNTPEGREMNEIYVVAIQVGVLVMAFMSDAVGLKYTTGPIILGLAIPDGQQLGKTLIAKTEFLVSEFLLPLFYFQIGTRIDLYKINHRKSFTQLQSIITAFYAAKTVGVTVAGLTSKISFKKSLVLSMMLNIKGIIELISYNRWYSLQLISDQFFTQLVLSLLAMTMLVTPIVRFSYSPQIGRGSKADDPQFRINIQSMPSKLEPFRIVCCVHNEESVHNMITLLEASNPTEESPITVYVVHAVQFIGRSAPLLVPYEEHKKKFKRSDTPSNQIMRAFENYTKNSRGPVHIQAYTMVAPYKSMHHTIFRLAQDKLVPLIIIPFHENHQSLVETGHIRHFNLNVEAYSPCTVGILVDRGFPCRMSSSSFFCNIAVFFIGGPDDREALAYASRMSYNPEVGITVFRIIVRITKGKGQEEEETEFKLDESLIDEFKLRNLGNDQLNWQDIEVDDCVQVMTAISRSQGQYDLVMVGRRHSEISLRNEEMVEFVQYPELGVIGDMLASSDFCGGMVNVLVMQESRDLGIGAFRCDSMKNSESGFKFSA